VLFADLVGFTSRAERLDPEDVRATLTPYFIRVREEIEAFGGTVEKFIGDAVMALFGAPVTHEDDPERAVRAALAIREAIRDLNESEPAQELQLRLAVTTGEALISLGARPSEGEGMASGDVVNTASRLQTAAPVNGILVGETTYRATRHAIEYREAPPVEAKGKAEPIAVWEALSARARLGVDVDERPRSALVGRERELEFLVEALARSRREASSQLVTLVGVPGIGKSRLVAELFQVVERDPDLIWWRQGRSLPYGESMSYWALGEIAKAQAGILETDSSEEAEAKLGSMVEDLVPDQSEHDWVERHLRPLVGLSVSSDGSGDRRSEAFSAWRRLLEALAEVRPLVLVFEDLHWADDGLLDFIDYLADWATGVPLLIVCTARPEMLDRRPGWGGGKRNTSTISIAALSPEETTRLLGGLLEQMLLPAEVQARLLARAEGNPLYAEEYVRMLQDRGFLVRGTGGWRLDSDGELPLPETVQGMIAARLDALPPAEKELVIDAAVIGKVFWPGALAAIGGRPASELEEALHGLERKEFVRRDRRSSVAGETQYAFLHLLVRDVAYGEIPRARRVDKHRLAAQWIESLASDRSEDRAEMLAHHYLEALSLAEAAGIDREPLRAPATSALHEASERAFALNAWRSAAGYAAAALELLDAGDGERPTLQFRIAQASWFLDEVDLENGLAACEGFREQGSPELAAEAEILVSWMFWGRGEQERAKEHGSRALALVEERPLTFSKSYVFAHLARAAFLRGDGTALELAERALPMAEEFGRDDLASNLLNTIGMARVLSGESAGISDLERSLELAEAANAPREILNSHNNLANMCWELGRLGEASEHLARGRRAAERYGNDQALRWLDGEDVFDFVRRGRWDEALAGADRFLEATAGSRNYLESAVREARAQVYLGRGELEQALADSERSLALAREAKDPQLLAPALLTRARALVDAGRSEEANTLLTELLGGHDAALHWLHELPLLFVRLGREQEYLAALGDESQITPWTEAGRAAATGDLQRAAAIYGEIGVRAAEAHARLLAAERLIAEGRRAEADAELRVALAFFREVRATAYAARGEALLAATA